MRLQRTERGHARLDIAAPDLHGIDMFSDPKQQRPEQNRKKDKSEQENKPKGSALEASH
ncbi:hypothetical protein YK56LOC_36260 [Caballeronia sp. HLA56]